MQRISSTLSLTLAHTMLLGVACSDPGGGGNGTPDATPDTATPAATCQRMLGMCDYSAEDVSRCEEACAVSEAEEDCWFPLCSVETGKCDNEEEGDPSILACGERRGWWPASRCAGLVDLDCAYDEDDVRECEEACGIGTSEEACWFAVCSVETGYCDNEEPGDPSIIACGESHGWR